MARPPTHRRPPRAAAGVLAAAALLLGCPAAPPAAEEAGAAEEDEVASIGTVTSADGLAVAYEERGAGSPALVLVHGWSCDRGYWAEQTGPFSARHRVVAVDLGGHGDSGLERQAWTIAAFGADVAAVVDALALERVVLVGHSMGGDVVVEAARRLPGRVAGLVWVDTYRKLGPPRSDRLIQGFLAPFRAEFAAATRRFVRTLFAPGADEALVERVVADMAAAPPEVAVEALESAVSYDRQVVGALAELGLPVFALNPAGPANDLASLERHGVGVVLQPGVGHFPMMEDPAAFNRLLAGILEDLARAGSGP